ncbi:hypothetical protein D3C73_963220 [compost metagenome]
MQERSGQEERQGRGHDGRDQRGDRGHGYGERNVALGKEGHDVGGGAGRCAANEDQADSQFGRQLQKDCNKPASAGHDHVVRHDAERYSPGAAGHRGKVRRGQGESHAEHDDAQQVGNRDAHGLEQIRNQEAEDAGYHHEKREHCDGDARDLGFSGKGGVRGSSGFFGFRRGIGCLKHSSMLTSAP